MSPDLHFASPVGADIHRLDTEISQSRMTRARAAKLQKKRDALYSPVHKLPDDLLLEVFHWGASTSPKAISFALTVSWVVSRWRRVAMSSTALWSDFDISILTSGLIASGGWKTFVARSGSRPLALSVRVPTRNTAIGPTTVALDDKNGVLSALVAQSRTLRVSTRGRWQVSCINTSRLLRSPTQTGLCLQELDLHLAWFYKHSELLTSLRNCSRLRRLSLTYVDISNLDAPADSVVELLELTSIHMRCIQGPSYTSVVLQYLKAPRLQSMSFDYINDAMEGPWTKNFSSVTSLSLRSFQPISTIKVARLICDMPSLKHLSLDIMISKEWTLPHLPSDVSLPPLVTINFEQSIQVDTFARWLVERVQKSHVEPTLEEVSACSGDGKTWLYMVSRDGLVNWMRERVPEVRAVVG